MIVSGCQLKPRKISGTNGFDFLYEKLRNFGYYTLMSIKVNQNISSGVILSIDTCTFLNYNSSISQGHSMK